MTASARLAQIATRLRRLAARPAGSPGRRRPGIPGRLLRWIFGQPHIDSGAVAALVSALDRDPGHVMAGGPGLTSLVNAAIRQLARDTAAVERAARFTGQVPAAQLSWLWRLYQIVYRARQLAQPSRDSWDRQTRAAAVTTEHLRPLGPPADLTAAPAAARAVDPVLDAARAEVQRLGRKRRLLEAARQLLLEAAAAGNLDRQGARDRARAIARELDRLDRLQAAGLNPEVDLLHQARQAYTRGDRGRLVAALSALEEGAFAAGQPALGRVGTRALDHLWGPMDRQSAAAQAHSLAQSHRQLLGERTRAAVQAGYDRALAAMPAVREQWLEKAGPQLLGHLDNYLRASDPTGRTLTVAVAADGCFELGGTVSPVRNLEMNERIIEVRHPTADLHLVPARGIADLPGAVLTDPRTLVTSLAEGTLLTRRYLGREIHTTSRPGFQNDARFYVLDGSGSMIGPRARMRDGLLVAELCTLARRLEDPRRAGNPVLYYRYFTDHLTDVRKVASAAAAEQAIEDVLGVPRLGPTDIEGALLASFEQIRLARQGDEQLVRAQLVLVTDGEADVDQAKVEQARAAVGDLAIGVSIIALGQENPALRALCARQRARGEPVFYQFIDDQTLEELEAGQHAGLPIHLPAEQGSAALPPGLDQLLAEMEQRARPLDAAEVDRADLLDPALAEVGLSLAEGLSEGARARREVLLQDRRGVDSRFLRWFPRPTPAPPAPVDPDDREELEEIRRLLATVAEVVDVGITAPLERRADAIEIMERLLLEVAMPPWRHGDLLRRHAPLLASELGAVHAAAAFAEPPEPGSLPAPGR
jgi:hypothetical protein